MPIERIEAIPLAYPEPNDHGATRYICLARISTSDGQVGWGEAITQFSEANLATAQLIDGLAEVLIGQDPVRTEALWRAMKDRAWWYGYGGGLASNAIAALDIALWDLKGITLDRSVLDLLGGPVVERLPAIASCHAHHASIEAMADEAAGWLEDGLQGMKVGFGKRGDAHLGYEHERDVAYVKSMRDVLDDRMLMIDMGIAIRWDLATAISRTRAFEEHGIDWIEEPLGAWDPVGYRTLRDHVTTRIAYGEREWNLDGYERVLSTGTCDVAGVDPGRAEGITGFKRVANRVEQLGRQTNAHAWSSAIVTAASLAVSFSTTSSRLFELKPLRNPMQHELVEEPFAHIDGWMYPPIDRPGLGITIVEEVVDHFRQLSR